MRKSIERILLRSKFAGQEKSNQSDHAGGSVFKAIYVTNIPPIGKGLSFVFVTVGFTCTKLSQAKALFRLLEKHAPVGGIVGLHDRMRLSADSKVPPMCTIQSRYFSSSPSGIAATNQFHWLAFNLAKHLRASDLKGVRNVTKTRSPAV